VLRLTRSFYGNEDPGLLDRLREERSGILHWAVEGLRRLRSRGRFVQPRSGEDDIALMGDLSSPIEQFVDELCQIGPDQRVGVDELFDAWERHCEEGGHEYTGDKTAFGRDLKSAAPSVKRRRTTGQRGFYEGIGLRGASV
jgi:putative DNA primase/helicase